MPQYAAKFEEASVDEVLLRSLTDDDLRQLGVEHFMHRRKILVHAARRHAAAAVAADEGSVQDNVATSGAGGQARPRRRQRAPLEPAARARAPPSAGDRPALPSGGSESDDEVDEASGSSRRGARRAAAVPLPARSMLFEVLRAAAIFATFLLLQWLWWTLTQSRDDDMLEQQRLAQLKQHCPPGVDCVRMWNEARVV